MRLPFTFKHLLQPFKCVVSIKHNTPCFDNVFCRNKSSKCQWRDDNSAKKDLVLYGQAVVLWGLLPERRKPWLPIQLLENLQQRHPHYSQDQPTYYTCLAKARCGMRAEVPSKATAGQPSSGIGKVRRWESNVLSPAGGPQGGGDGRSAALVQLGCNVQYFSGPC